MRNNRFRTILIGVLLAWPVAFAMADDPQPASRPATRPATQPATRPAELSAAQLAQLEKLIEQMRDSNFAKREAADAKIRKMGVLALPVIRKYVNDDDAELSDRAEQIATFLDLKIPVRADQIDAQLVLNNFECGVRPVLVVTLTNKTAKPTLMASTIGYGSIHPSGYFVIIGPDGKQIPPQLSSRSKMLTRRKIPQVFVGHQVYVRSVHLGMKSGIRNSPNTAKGLHTQMILQDRRTFFSLLVPGEYTIQLRIDGKFVANAAKKAIKEKLKPRHGGTTSIEGVLGFIGVIESNVVTFEIKK